MASKSTIRRANSVFSSDFGVNLHVLSFSYKQKVFRPVVQFVLINMMNFFSFPKRSSQHFRHNRSMFSHSSSYISHWIREIINPFITIARNSSTLPPTIFFTDTGTSCTAQTTGLIGFLSSDRLLTTDTTNNYKLSLSAAISFPIQRKGSWFIPNSILQIKSFFKSIFDYHSCIVSKEYIYVK